MGTMTFCLCGCGKAMEPFDSRGRPVKYIKGHNNKNFKGVTKKRFVNTEGYVMIYMPDHLLCNVRGFISEHRLVYEESRDCCLLPYTDIHHLDGNKTNNVWYNVIPYWRSQHMAIERRGTRLSGDHRLNIGLALKGKIIVNMDGRQCAICKSIDTQYRRNKRPIWYSINNMVVCNRCYKKDWARNYRRKQKQIDAMQIIV